MRGAVLAIALAACHQPGTTPPPAVAWALGPSVPVARYEPGVTALGDQLVVAGGFTTSPLATANITTQIDVLDVTAGTWNQSCQLPAAPAALADIQLAATATTLYLLGGLQGSAGPAIGTAWSLDTTGWCPPTTPASPGWTAIAAMPSGSERGGAVVLVAPPRIYLIGGQSATGAVGTAIYYDTIANAWGTDVPALPAARAHAAGMRRSDGGLVIAGGLASLAATGAAADAYQLPVGATQWVAGASMPTATGDGAFGVVEGQLVTAGGESGGAAIATVQSYDALVDQWTPNSTAAAPAVMPAATTGTPGAAIGQRLFVPGGVRDLQLVPTDTLYIYVPFDARD